MNKETLTLSPLSHTWILDFDGTLVIHNGYKTGEDHFLPGALEFLHSIPKDDVIIILTAREPEAKDRTESFYRTIMSDITKSYSGFQWVNAF